MENQTDKNTTKETKTKRVIKPFFVVYTAYEPAKKEKECNYIHILPQ